MNPYDMATTTTTTTRIRSTIDAGTLSETRRGNRPITRGDRSVFRRRRRPCCASNERNVRTTPVVNRCRFDGNVPVGVGRIYVRSASERKYSTQCLGKNGFSAVGVRDFSIFFQPKSGGGAITTGLTIRYSVLLYLVVGDYRKNKKQSLYSSLEHIRSQPNPIVRATIVHNRTRRNVSSGNVSTARSS